MRLGSLLMTVVGLGVAGGAVYYAQMQLNAVPVVQEQRDRTVRVIAASQDIPFGRVIEDHMLTTIAWPETAVPAGALTERSSLIPQAGGEPRRAKRAIAKGELVMTSKVSDWGEKVTIVQTIGKNNRAMAIKVNASTGVGGFVTPGDEVDIVLTRGGRNTELRTLTILQKIRVIGVDQRADELSEQAAVARTVTVEVTPEQGQKLALAQRAGTLSLSLRSLETEEDAPLEAVRLSDLLLDKSPSEGEAKSVVRVRRGANEITEQVVN